MTSSVAGVSKVCVGPPFTITVSVTLRVSHGRCSNRRKQRLDDADRDNAAHISVHNYDFEYRRHRALTAGRSNHDVCVT
jgi:hypothetical protein